MSLARISLTAFIVVLALFGASAATPLRAEVATDCFSEDWGRRVAGCTIIIESNTATPAEKAQAYAMRALALSIKGQYESAIRDYDESIRIAPDFAVALNNRAWAYFKWGRGSQGLADVERSLQLNPLSEHTWDTRAHIRQTLGQFSGAFADYERAVDIGGERMIKLYQCGLTEAGIYRGKIDGIYSNEVRDALRQCAHRRDCDPLPGDEQCRQATS
jgi:tetratricopeptide (TPR) repeat protein